MNDFLDWLQQRCPGSTLLDGERHLLQTYFATPVPHNQVVLHFLVEYEKAKQEERGTIPKKPPIESAIIGEIYKAVERLGGDFTLLGSIGSWGDTLPEEMVLANLQAWNRAPYKWPEFIGPVDFTKFATHHALLANQQGTQAATLRVEMQRTAHDELLQKYPWLNGDFTGYLEERRQAEDYQISKNGK